jgi:hypothetical protein
MKSSLSFGFGIGIGFGIGMQPLSVSVPVAFWPIPKLPKFRYRPKFRFRSFTNVDVLINISKLSCLVKRSIFELFTALFIPLLF